MLKRLLLPAVLVALVWYGCNKPESILDPTHYGRVPAPYNLSASYDTTATGKLRVQLSWKVPSTINLKNFEIYKAVGTRRTFFVLPQSTVTTTVVDTFNYTLTDTLKLYYYILPYGTDRFVGKSSDTIYLPITNLN